MTCRVVFYLIGADVMRAMLLLFAFLTTATASVASADVTPPTIEHEPVVRAVTGEVVRVQARIIDESEIFAATLYYRELGQRSYASVPMRFSDGFFVAEFTIRGPVEYWLEAYDEFGNGPTREGEPEAPIRLTPISPKTAERLAALGEDAGPLPEQKPFYKEVWFLTTAGVVGAAAIGLTVYALQPTDVYRNTFAATLTLP